MDRILIIEDDREICSMYQKILSLSGYDVQIASDGEDGLVKAQEFIPKLILLDLIMPKKSGMEVLMALKANPSTQGIPVVVITNLSGGADAETILAHGAERYIIKSDYEPKQIADLVTEILESKKVN